jgi:hypothetical protein
MAILNRRAKKKRHDNEDDDDIKENQVRFSFIYLFEL